MSRGAKYAFIQHLEDQAEIKARELYWEKIFAAAHHPAKKSKIRKNRRK